MLNVYLLYGAPTSGKGTICKSFPPEHVISIGQLLRQRGLGHDGQLIQDSEVNNILCDELKNKKDMSYVILDGYPRTLEQCHFLKKLPYISLTRLYYLSCLDETVLYRTLHRESCQCGASYMPGLKPSKVSGICDLCQHPLFKRQDDNNETVQRRLDIFHKETKDILSEFKDICITIDMNGNKCFDQAFQVIGREKRNDFRFLIDASHKERQ